MKYVLFMFIAINFMHKYVLILYVLCDFSIAYFGYISCCVYANVDNEIAENLYPLKQKQKSFIFVGVMPSTSESQIFF